MSEKIGMLIHVSAEIHDRIPKPKKVWAEGIIAAAGARLPAVERDKFGEVLQDYVFQSGEEIAVSKGTSMSDAWGKLGWPGDPDNWGLKADAIKGGWYVPPKSVMDVLMEE